MAMEQLITRKAVAEKLASYLRHELSLDSLVTWAESALMEGEFDQAYLSTIRDAVARIGVADVRAFGLTWEDCEQLLAQLGYSAQVSIVAQ
jgi:cobyrinic acid a,c-diamide synthase